MNILPKKRWHVRTKDNIARVRKDEAAAREEERKKEEKLKLAESEARVNFLRKCSGLPEKHKHEENNETPSLRDGSSASQHVDLFSDYKSHVKTSNKELEKEKKEEQEKYEKKIGYLTYLGQDTNEALRLKSWYEKAPTRIDDEYNRSVTSEKDLKTKHDHDPLTLIKALLPTECKLHTNSLKKRKRSTSPQVTEPKTGSTSSKKPKKDHKKGKHKKRSKDRKNKRRCSEDESEKVKKMEKLRRERLRRETAERARQDALLAPNEPKKIDLINSSATKVVQKYNSQFNPELAKQNLN